MFRLSQTGERSVITPQAHVMAKVAVSLAMVFLFQSQLGLICRHHGALSACRRRHTQLRWRTLFFRKLRICGQMDEQRERVRSGRELNPLDVSEIDLRQYHPQALHGHP
jgi:hypothetical protein